MGIEATELEIGYLSLNKKGEELCGDHVETIMGKNGDATAVLADGLGSGVQANILSTLTSSMLSKMIEGGLSLEESVSSIMRTLPVAKNRGNVAYSTFTIVKVNPDFSYVLYNYDNPEPLLIRDGQEKKLRFRKMMIEGKNIEIAEGVLLKNDALILMSDGVIFAGVGETLNFGWTRKEVGEYMCGLFDKSVSAKNLATILVDRADVLYNHRPGDDTTSLVIRRRPRVNVNLLVGPASNPDDDEKMMGLFFRKEGKHLISGGTTAKVASRYLGKKITGTLNYPDPEIPPISHIEGVDLVTEGVITLNRVVELAKNYLNRNDAYFTWSFQDDGASLLAKTLFEEATDIAFFVGCAVNAAHQDPKLGISISTKMQLVDELTKSLKAMGKHIRVAYF